MLFILLCLKSAPVYEISKRYESCPPDTVIDNVKECLYAAKALRVSYLRQYTNERHPPGCNYHHDIGTVMFNTIVDPAKINWPPTRMYPKAGICRVGIYI